MVFHFPLTSRRRVIAGILAAAVAGGVIMTSVQSSSAAATWKLSSVATGSGGTMTIDAKWQPPADVVGTYVFDLELKNTADQKVKQWHSTVSVQAKTAMQSTVQAKLADLEDGTYTVHQGVFTENWASQVFWSVGTQQITVKDQQWVETSAVAASAPATAPDTEPGTKAPTATSATPRKPVVPATPAKPGVATTGNPIGGLTFYGTNAGAAQQAAAWAQSRPADAALMRRMAAQPFATWVGGWSGDPATAVSSTIAKAGTNVPTFVLYNIPGRDCELYSAGGAVSGAEYSKWIDGIATGAGNGRAVFIVEPDGITGDCADDARYALIRSAVTKLTANPNAVVYIDAGNPGWRSADEMADRLTKAGVADAQGFALNVSNFATTEANVAYGQKIAALTGGKHFVIDTSRNGNGPGADWCNPAGRALGQEPTTSTGITGVDAFIWGKTAGESDGTCNGGPAAGTWWPEYALGLAQAAWN